MKLNELEYNEGSKKRRKRIGRGRGSGHGKTSCKGHKGQKARSGGSIPAWFEGGQMPLKRRLPKRGFTNIFKKEYEEVNVGSLAIFDKGTEVNSEKLRERRLVRKPWMVKILGDGDITIPLVVYANKFTGSAKEKIEKAGGKAVVI